MAGVLQHLRSSTLNKRPNPASMVDGQLAINYASGSPGAFFKDTNGNLVKVGPVHVGTTAPNVSPASGGTAGNSLGEQWLDTSGGTYVFKIWDGSAWRSEAGEFVNSTGDTMTGSLTMGPSVNLIFEGSTDDGFETTLTVVDPTADRTITLPNVSGTVVTTGDSGTVTSTMITDGTIVNADVNASAAIAGTKISPDFGSQTIQTTGVFSHAVGSAGAPIITFTGDTNTGIYSPGADQVAISTGGSGRLFVDASGRVGIGASGPGFPLEVRATSSTGQVQMLGSDNTNATWRLATPSSSVVAFGGATTHAVAFGGFDNTTQAFSERARIDSSGRLLVGTSSSSAEAKFIVQGGATAAGGAINIQRNATTASAGSTIGFINFANSADNVGATISADGDGTWSAGTSHPTLLKFSTTADGASSPTERMKITRTGEIYVFCASGAWNHSANNGSGAGTESALYQGRYGATDNTGTTGTRSYVVWTNGNVQNTNNSYTAISDIKLKENVVDANSQWADIKSLQVRNYNLKEGQTHRQIGLIAQEVELISPGLVYESPDRDDDGNDLGTVTKSVNYSVLYMKAVKALQEAMERIETLEAKVAALESA